MRFPAQAEAGFLLTLRWCLRPPLWAGLAALGGGTAAVAAAAPAAARTGALAEATGLLVPLAALVLGAFAVSPHRPPGRLPPLTPFPLRPWAFLLGQFTALALVLAAATAVPTAVAAAAGPHRFRLALPLPPPVLTGPRVRLRGVLWARSGGTWTWRVPSGGGEFETRFRALYEPAQAGELLRFATPAGVRRCEPEAPLRLSASGGVVRLRLLGRGVYVAPLPGASWVVRPEHRGRLRTWGGYGADLWRRGLFLLGAAGAAALWVSPPLALLGGLTVWAVGWAVPFLRELALHQGAVSLPAAWTGAPPPAGGGGLAGAVGALLRFAPDLRGAAAAELLLRGLSPGGAGWLRPWGRSLPGLLVVLAAWLLGGELLWRRLPGRQPGAPRGG